MTQDKEQFLSWRGQELKTLGDFHVVMTQITESDEAQNFSSILREKFGIYGESHIIRLAGLSQTPQDMIDLMNRFLGQDFSEEFYLTEAPQDKYGNFAYGTYVMKVRIVSGYQGTPHLEVLEPKEIASRWPTMSTFPYDYLLAEGPARMLQHHEWGKLVHDRKINL